MWTTSPTATGPYPNPNGPGLRETRPCPWRLIIWNENKGKIFPKYVAIIATKKGTSRASVERQRETRVNDWRTSKTPGQKTWCRGRGETSSPKFPPTIGTNSDKRDRVAEAEKYKSDDLYSSEDLGTQIRRAIGQWSLSQLHK